MQDKIFTGGDVAVKVVQLGDHADDGADSLRLSERAVPFDKDFPAGGTDQGGKDIDEGGFACAVGAKQAENGPPVNFQGKIIYRPNPAV
jgi:hypothetical protein